MQKHLLAGLLLVFIAAVAARNPAVYIADAPKSEENVELPVTSLDAYVTLVKNNLGLLKKAPKDAESSKIIKEYRSNGNIFNSLVLNYLVLYESNAEESQLKRSSPQFKLIHPNTADVNVVATLLDKLYNASEIPANDGISGKKPWYLFTDDSKEFAKHQQYALFPLITPASGVKLFEASTHETHSVSQNLMRCINSEFPKMFDYEEQKNAIFTYNSDVSVRFTDDQKPLFELFLADICSLAKLPSMISAERSMSFLTIHIKSLLNLEAVATKDQDLTVVYRLFEAALRKFHQRVQKKFGANQVAGHAVSVPSDKKLEVDAVKTEVEAHKTIKFNTEEPIKRSHKRILQTATATAAADPSSRQIYVWFSVGFFLALLWILSQLFTEEQTKDTLLYAKFVTGPEGR